MNRIEPNIQEFKSEKNLVDRMDLILYALNDTVTPIPEAGNICTFKYYAKTLNIQYDQHPLIICGNVYKWGFNGINEHWGTIRQYSWGEVLSNVYELSEEEFQTLAQVPLALYKNT